MTKERSGNGGPAPARLVLAGLGVKPPAHATVEALQALGRCDVIFCNMAGDAITEFLAPFCRDLRPIAFRDEADLEPCVRKVLEQCAPGRTVGFATYGHALVFGPLADELLRRAGPLGIEVRALPSVSSLDFLLSETGLVLGHGFHGFQVYEHHELDQGARPSRRLPTIVFFANAMGRADLERVRDALARSYPADHPAFLFGGLYESGARIPLRISELPDRAADIDGRRQLFVPPAPPPAAG